MADKKYGLQETKEVIDLAAELGLGLKMALADGELSLSDLAYLLPGIQKVPAAIDKIDLVPKELADLDEAEAKELMEYMAAKLDKVLPEGELRELVEKGLKSAVVTLDFVLTLIKFLEPPPQPVPVPAGPAAKP